MKKKFLYRLCIIFSAFYPVSKSLGQVPQGQGYVLLFDESFAGNKVNEKNWRYRVDRRQGFGYMDGLDRKENVYIRDSALHVIVRQEVINGRKENTGGGLISTHNFGYGYYECLSKPFMAGVGVHSAFWQRGGANPNNNIFEIDAYEIDSKTYVATNNLYVDLAPKGMKYSPWPHRAQVPFKLLKDGWFLDSYEFTPDGVIFYDNGKVVAKAEWNELNAAQMVWLTALNGVGKVDSTQQPGETLFKYFRFYAKDYPGVTILPNGNFEYNQNRTPLNKPVCWAVEGTQNSVNVVEGDSYRDRYKLRIGSGGNFKSSISQELDYIMNGEYNLNLMVRSSSIPADATVEASDFGGKPVHTAVKGTGEWTMVTIPQIFVRNNHVKIKLSARGLRDQWLEVDDMNFMKPALAGQAMKTKQPFFPEGDPIWKLASKEPITFTGDQKFYFFDRNVGLGDSISINFDLNAAAMANTIPIARIPKKGKSGWAIQLQKDGGLIFRIGSVESHEDILASNVYEQGKTVSISCQFINGTASIFKNGDLVKQQVSVPFDTKDITAAGRVGTVGKDFEAVGEVVMQVGNSDRESSQMKNFRGTIQHLRVYNKKVL